MYTVGENGIIIVALAIAAIVFLVIAQLHGRPLEKNVEL
jgi:hypothetical protein